MKKIKISAIVIISLLLLTINTLNSESQSEKVIVYATPYDFEEFSVFTAQSYVTHIWQSATTEGLYARSSDGSYVHELAEGQPMITILPDETMKVTIILKDNIYFNNGDLLTAEDVVFTYQLYLSPQIYLSANANFYRYEKLIPHFASNASIVALDANTVQFTFNHAYVHYKTIISEPIMPKSVYVARYEAGDYYYNNPNGSDANGLGPFIVGSIATTSMVVTLTKNENYHGDEPLVDKIIFKKYDTKEAVFSDMAAGNTHIVDSQYVIGLDEAASLTGVLYESVAYPSTHELSFNHLNPYINGSLTPAGIADPSNYLEYGKYVRKAISHLIDRDFVVNEIMQGLASQGSTLMPSVCPGWLGYDDIPYRNYSVETAKNFMELAGYDYTTDVDLEADITASNSLFSLYILSPNTNPARNMWAIMLETELAEIGIFVAMHLSTSWSTLLPLTFESDVPCLPGAVDTNNDLVGWDLFFVGFDWGIDYNPAGLFDSTSVRPYGDNIYNFPGDVAELDGTSWDSLLINYLTEVDDVARVEKVELLQRFLYEWEPVATIMYPEFLWVYLDIVSGIDVLSLSIYAQQWEKIDLDIILISELNQLTPIIWLLSNLIISVIVFKRKIR